MSQDDKFFSDSDKTVIRPNPGGRRGAAPSSPAAAPMGGAPRPALGDGPATLPSVGLNPLVSAAAPLLALAVRLRNTASFGNVDALRERVIQEIRAFERRVSATDQPREALRGAHYAICATIDDVINNTPWGTNAQWARSSMTGTFHNDVAGGERFFEFLNHFQREPGRYGDVLEFMYLCLSLGFEGRFRVAQRGASDHARLREGLYTLLRQRRGERSAELSPHWRGLEAPHRPLSAVLPLWVVGAGLAAILTFAFIVFSYLLNISSDTAFAKFAALPPQGAVALVVAAPAPPPPVHDGIVPRLTTFLAPEVRAGLVSLSETAQTATIRIRGSDLFASGTAELNSSFLPLMDRIAAALDTEPGAVKVIGHTDNVPIRSLRFPSNYQLSLARAETVRDLLRRKLKQPRDLVAQGRADADPIASNATSEGRALNRRIELVLVKQEADQ